MRVELSAGVFRGDIDFRQVPCTGNLKIVRRLDKVGPSDSTWWYHTSTIPTLVQQARGKS